MNPIVRTILTFVCVVSFVATPYYFWSGFEHLGASGTSSQPTAGAISIIIFLFAFFIAVQLTPKKTDKCPSCGHVSDTKKFTQSPLHGE